MHHSFQNTEDRCVGFDPIQQNRNSGYLTLMYVGNSNRRRPHSTGRFVVPFILALVALAMFALHFAARESQADSRIEASAAKSYALGNVLNGDSIATKARRGVVTLSGTVNEASHKLLAEETLAGMPEVTKVINQIIIVGDPQITAATVADPQVVTGVDDASITAQVKAALLFHDSTSAFHTSVSTKAGTVTLSGEARDEAERDQVAKLSKDINGVKSVTNNMTLKIASTVNN